MQKIKTNLTKISENSKKIKSRMSKYIKALKEYIRNNAGQFTETDAEFLFIGNDKIPGLLFYTGTEAKFSGGLKNSSLTALNLIKELLEVSTNDVFTNVFFNLDSAYYSKLKLNLHLQESDENKLIALTVCKYIKVG